MVERAKEQQIPQKFWNRLQKGEEIECEGRLLHRIWFWGPTTQGTQGNVLYGYAPCSL